MRNAILLSAVLLLLPGLALGAGFDEQREAVSASVATQSEAVIVSLLKSGLSENKQSQAHSVARGWFLQNQPRDSETLLLAAQVAEQSAHYAAAIAFYQQYLEKADPASDASQEAVRRLYRLMIDVMQNESNAAYFFILNRGQGFIPHGSAKQYNRWFLDEALRRHNYLDIARFLRAVCRAKLSETEMKGLYTPYFKALLLPDMRFGGDVRRRETIELGEQLEALGKEIFFDERMKRLFLWRGAVLRYNASRFADIKPIPQPPLAAAEALLTKYPEYGAQVWEDLYVSSWHASAMLMKPMGEQEAKVGLLRKYLPKLSPVLRYRVLQTLAGYDKEVVTGSERAMLNTVHPNQLKGVKLMDAEASEAARLKEFRTLLKDFDSPEPELAHVAERLVAVVGCTPSVWGEMLTTPQREWILYRAVTEKARVSADEFRYAVHPHHNRPPHWAEPHLRALVEALAAKKQIRPWLTMAWINSYKPQWSRHEPFSDPAGVELMKALTSLPTYAKQRYKLHWAAEEVFRVKTEAAREMARQVNSGVVCKELLALSKDTDAEAAQAAIETVLLRLRTAPSRTRIAGHAQLSQLKPEVIGAPEVLPLLLELLDNPHTPLWGEGEVKIFYLIVDQLQKSPDPDLLHRHAAGIWYRAWRESYGNRGINRMQPLLQSLVDGHPSALATMARARLHMIEQEQRRNPSRTPVDKESTIALLGRANQQMKLSVIAVDESDPAYPVYKSQNDFVSGNIESAWKLFEENAEIALAMHRKLSPRYLLWVLARLIDQRNEEGQERVAEALRQWRQDSASALTRGQSIRLDILHGDMARQRGGRGLDTALKIYKSIQNDEKNAGHAELYTAILRRIEVERIMKDFPAALQTADDLIRQKVPQMWAAGRYAKALVYFDMEDYGEVRDLLDEILAREPGHKDAKILEGKVLLKHKALVDASEVEIPGTAVEKNAITPGEELKVTLTDPSLAVSGGGTDIEVDVWASSGDRETILLAQFGDSKTKFRGSARVRLGRPNPGDGVLQVIGDDEVYYAYSKRFMEKVKMEDARQGGPITILSDATLMASARRLLTLEEQKAADAEALAATLVNPGAFRDLSAEEVESLAQQALATADLDAREEMKAMLERQADKARLQARVKPGNPIYLRVVDEDRSRTAGVDELLVSVESSSGDSVGQVHLKETGTHTGTFEGMLPTRGAQAMVFASSTRSGLNPNMVISPKTYGAWRSAPGKEKGTATLTVDLNDNVALGTLRVIVSEAGMALQRFRLLAGMNRNDLKPVATWPVTAAVKDPLAPSIFLTHQHEDRHRHDRADKDPFTVRELRGYLDREYLYQRDPQTHARTLAGPAEAFSEDAWRGTPWIKGATHPNHVSNFLATRFHAHFMEVEEVQRHFRIVLGKAPEKLVVTKGEGRGKRTYQSRPGTNHPSFISIDGRPLSAKGRVYEGVFQLNPGLHRLEILSQGRASAIGFGRSCTVQTRLDPDDPWEECPASMFDPATFPDAVRERFSAPPVVAYDKAKGAWQIDFAEKARARVLSLDFLQHQGPDAALNRLTLTDAEGKTVLPVPTDYAELTKNDTLEILTGDTIWVRYVDDRCTSKAKQRQERKLHVAFSDAKAHFLDIEPRYSSRHQSLQPFREKLLRFRMDEPLSLVVDDPDMDVSDKPDHVEVVLKATGGTETKVRLTETEPSSGTFRAFVVPVVKAASRPDQIQVKSGGAIHLQYWDRENVKPGVPTARTASIPHAEYKTPTMALTHMEVEPGVGGGGHIYNSLGRMSGLEKHQAERLDSTRSTLRVRSRYVETTAPGAKAKDVSVLLGRIAVARIVAPHLLLRPSSNVHLFLQTETARKRASGQEGGGQARSPQGEPFDVSLPGTRLLSGTVNGGELTAYGFHPKLFPIYADEQRLDNFRAAPEGSFHVPILVMPGSIEESGLQPDPKALKRYATAGARTPLQGEALSSFLADISPLAAYKRGENYERDRCKLQDLPAVRPGEQIHLGLRYEDEAGKVQWITTSARVRTHGQLDVLPESGGMTRLENAAVGDRIRVRVLDLGRDTSDGMDEVSVRVQSKSGADYPLVLTESAPHSGAFLGSLQLVISRGEPVADLDIRLKGFPVRYGDTVSLSYTDSADRPLGPFDVSLGLGADGAVMPFSKQYGDDEVATRTQFALAESHLELAKRYLKLKDEKAAALSYERAKQLLASTIDRFTDAETRAHAEYLLGNLTYEEAGNTKDHALQQDRYHAALARFLRVTTSYPESTFASKAQFKKAVTYERLREPEIAAQEYVKLAYKYPESEYLAIAMYRLGIYFLVKAKQAEREMAPLAKQIDGKEPEAVDRDVRFKLDLLTKARDEHYGKSAEIFTRLLERFPTHELAAQAGLRGAKIYYQLDRFDDALPIFKVIYAGKNYDSENRAEAMYWAGKCHNNLGAHMAAYAIFMRCTEDFPETRWAGHVYAELAEPRYRKIDKSLQIENVQKGLGQ